MITQKQQAADALRNPVTAATYAAFQQQLSGIRRTHEALKTSRLTPHERLEAYLAGAGASVLGPLSDLETASPVAVPPSGAAGPVAAPAVGAATPPAAPGPGAASPSPSDTAVPEQGLGSTAATAGSTAAAFSDVGEEAPGEPREEAAKGALCSFEACFSVADPSMDERDCSPTAGPV